MKDRRRPSAAARIAAITSTEGLSSQEFVTLRGIYNGFQTREKFRINLAKKGLITTSVTSKCQITEAGKSALRLRGVRA